MQIDARRYGLWDLVKLPLQAGPGAAILTGLNSLLSGIVPTLHVVVTASFIDTAIAVLQGSAERSEIYSRLFAVVALIAYSWVSGSAAKLARTKLGLALQEHYHTAITEKRARLHYRHIEDPESWDLISRVTSRPEGQLSDGYNLLLSMAALIFRVLGVLGILISQVWWAAVVIILLSVPLFALAVKSGKASYEASKETEKYRRKSSYLSSILTSSETVDERSLFGYGDPINEMWHERYETARKIEHRVRRKWFIRTKIGSLITAFLSVLIVVVLLNPVLAGDLSIGLFMSLVVATFSLVQMMSWGLGSYVDQLAKFREYLKDLTKFAMLEESDSAQMLPADPAPEFQSLDFKNVSFKYPGMEKYVLRNLSLRMEAGKHYAFVGVNGSGKTTITKLIAGLYDNYSGEILLNGKNLREWDPAELKAMLSIVILPSTTLQSGTISPWAMSIILKATAIGASTELSIRWGLPLPWKNYRRASTHLLAKSRRTARTSPVVNGSGSPWPERLPTQRRCGSWMSPQPPSILSAKVSYTKSSSGSAAARPRSLSATALGPPNWRMKSL